MASTATKIRLKMMRRYGKLQNEGESDGRRLSFDC